MTLEQSQIIALLAVTLALFICNRWRYDIVAAAALFAAVALGLVPAAEAFSGFADPVVTTVACALILSYGVAQSGLPIIVLDRFQGLMQTPTLRVLIFSLLVAVCSAFINNVAALALFLPAAIGSAKTAKQSPSALLMPMAFASLLGGLTTLIGTPPNLMISAIREKITGKPYEMFDFGPVGIVLVVIGLLYLVYAWRKLPMQRAGAAQNEQFNIEDYLTEVVVGEKSLIVGKTIAEIEKMAEDSIAVVGLTRGSFHRIITGTKTVVFAGDVLVLEGDPETLNDFVVRMKLELVGGDKKGDATKKETEIAEAIITEASSLIGHNSKSFQLRTRYQVNLLAIRRRGRNIRQRLGSITFEEGDVIVVQGYAGNLTAVLQWLQCLPLARRDLKLGQSRKPWLVGLVMAAVITLSVLKIFPVAVAFLAGVLALIVLKRLSAGDIYKAVDWPIIILLGAMIPVTGALETTGAAQLIAGTIAGLAPGLGDLWVVGLVMFATMAITPMLNNAATVLLMAPLAVNLGQQIGLAVDPLLMAVAIGASCDFLTPIGHQSNTLVMGPGGYRFSDYWKLGLPLSIFVLIGGTLMIELVWM
ncbi:MAG: SLC13 family permease [Alphaproteobacteria bacterium]|nr:SLC13 family permease [Alphaproteobacteria bacterium]